jgi:hypothetical protein
MKIYILWYSTKDGESVIHGAYSTMTQAEIEQSKIIYADRNIDTMYLRCVEIDKQRN